MTHRAEQIMAAVQARVTNLTTAGARVDRGRADTIDVTNTPALRVAMGSDKALEPWAYALGDFDLDVSVFAYAYDSAQNIETLLNKMRSEVTVALMADQTLGLGFVLNIVELGAADPELTGDKAKPAGKLECEFRVRYRRSVTNPDA
jgi:hypothetical protein